MLIFSLSQTQRPILWCIRVKYTRHHRYTGKTELAQVPERAVHQALRAVFATQTTAYNASSGGAFNTRAQFSHHNQTRFLEESMPWGERSTHEQQGATLAAWIWLLAQSDPRAFQKALPWGALYYPLLGKRAFDFLCDSLNLSAHERALLILPEWCS